MTSCVCNFLSFLNEVINLNWNVYFCGRYLCNNLKLNNIEKRITQNFVSEKTNKVGLNNRTWLSSYVSIATPVICCGSETVVARHRENCYFFATTFI